MNVLNLAKPIPKFLGLRAIFTKCIKQAPLQKKLKTLISLDQKLLSVSDFIDPLEAASFYHLSNFCPVRYHFFPDLELEIEKTPFQNF